MTDMHIMPSPRQVDIAITGKCNLACQYCFYADEMVARTNLPTERWLSFFDELGSLSVMIVTLTGGEVFTRPDLFELIDGIIANHMRYDLLSNGTLINEEILSQFEIGKRRQRLNSIQISIDGSRAEIHDRSRPHSFDRAIRGLRLLVQAKYPVTVRLTINRHNLEDLDNIAHLLLEEIGLSGFSTNDAFPCDATNRLETDIVLTPGQTIIAQKKLIELNTRYKGRITATAGPLAQARQLQRIDQWMAEGQTSMPGYGTLGSCGGVFKNIAVMQDGTIVPCHNISTIHLGTIGTDSLQKIWTTHPSLIQLRQRSFIPLASLETCQDCPYIGFCCGGCPGGALFLTGKINGRNPMDCYRIVKGEEEFFIPGGK